MPAGMVDRVYQSGIPRLRKSLEDLRREFNGLGTRTDWARIRIEPVLRHAQALERILLAPRHTQALGRLTRGVALFHSDLVYLRTNVQELRRLLETERSRRSAHRSRDRSPPPRVPPRTKGARTPARTRDLSGGEA
jgi:hypothetical protein